MMAQQIFNNNIASADAPKKPLVALVIDSHRQDLSRSKNMLRQNGFQTITAASVENALVIIFNEKIDVLIIEVKLPGNSFLTFCQSIRNGEIESIPPDILIIVCSGIWENMQNALCREAGVDVFFYKPLDAELLLDCLKTKNRSLHIT